MPEPSPSLLGTNGRIVNLTQAMLGSITPNFRAVSIELTPAAVNLYFLLERDSEADREEIEDIVFEYTALEVGFSDSREVIESVVVSAEEAPMLPMRGFHVFRRKE